MAKIFQTPKMIKIYTLTLLKWEKCHKILKNEQSNLKPTKIPSKSKKSSVLFWGFNGIYDILRVSVGILVVFGAFWSFSRVWGYFGYSWFILVILAVSRVSFLTIWCIYQFFDILEILTGKIIFLTNKP